MRNHAVNATQAAELACRLLRLDGATATPFGAGKFSRTFLIQNPSSEYVLRIAPTDSVLQLFYEYRMMRQEPELHRLIEERTDVPIPKILAYDFSRTVIDRDYLIMNRLPGTAMSEVADRLTRTESESILAELGRCVAKLHGIRGRHYGYIGPHRPMEPQSDWPAAFAVMWGKLVEDCVRCGVYNEHDRALALRLFDKHHAVFDPSTPAALCHMDLWVANILVHDKRLSALFDFDRACFGDPENDLAVAEYCGLTGEPFWRGYVEAGGRRPLPSHEQAVRRWFYLLYEHAKYIVISMSARHNNPRRARRYADECRLAMTQFNRTDRPAF